MQYKGIKEKVNRSIMKQSYRLSLDETKNIHKIGNARGRLQHGGCARSEDSTHHRQFTSDLLA
jgi:hypothetical protein